MVRKRVYYFLSQNCIFSPWPTKPPKAPGMYFGKRFVIFILSVECNLGLTKIHLLELKRAFSLSPRPGGRWQNQGSKGRRKGWRVGRVHHWVPGPTPQLWWVKGLLLSILIIVLLHGNARWRKIALKSITCLAPSGTTHYTSKGMEWWDKKVSLFIFDHGNGGLAEWQHSHKSLEWGQTSWIWSWLLQPR